MKKIISIFSGLFFSQTAKDTFWVMTANVISGIAGLLITVLIARSLSVADFGTFSSLLNLAFILAALVDLGMAQGVVNFLPPLLIKKQVKTVRHYLSNMMLVILIMAVTMAISLQVLPSTLAQKLAGTSNRLYLLVCGLVVISFSFYFYFLGVFQAFKKFLNRTLIEITFALSRVGFLTFLIFRGLNIVGSLLSVVFGGMISFFLIWKYWPLGKIKASFSFSTIRKIFRFSRWLWFTNMIINIYGKIDILLLTILTSSVIVGEYSAAARLSLVFPLAVNSLNAVVSPRFASFSDRRANVAYLQKVFLLSLSVAGGFLIWLILAKPMILIIYGLRYQKAIKLFQGLVLANIPLLLTIPATNSLIYFFKKPKLITGISALQLMVVGLFSWFLIPYFGAFALIYSFSSANLLGLFLVYMFWFYFHSRKEYSLLI